VSFFPVSQPASIAILHHLSKDEGAHDSIAPTRLRDRLQRQTTTVQNV
jgi:hypothetical protein